jgi:hypothetical protein
MTGPAGHEPGLGEVANRPPVEPDRVHVRLRISGGYPEDRARGILLGQLADMGVPDPDSITWEWGVTAENGSRILYASAPVPPKPAPPQ